MGIGNITSKLTTGVKKVAKTVKEISMPKVKNYAQHVANEAAEAAKDAYGRASVNLSQKATDADAIKKLATQASDVVDDVAEKAPQSLKEQVNHSSSFKNNSKVFMDTDWKIIGEYGSKTHLIKFPESFKKNLIEETIQKADGTLYKSADELVSEAENGAKAVMSALGEKSCKDATSSATVFIEHGKTAVEKSLDDSSDFIAKAQRKADLQAKYGDKLAKAKDEQLKKDALAKARELAE